jgi:hypothetical protein
LMIGCRRLREVVCARRSNRGSGSAGKRNALIDAKRASQSPGRAETETLQHVTVQCWKAAAITDVAA